MFVSVSYLYAYLVLQYPGVVTDQFASVQGCLCCVAKFHAVAQSMVCSCAEAVFKYLLIVCRSSDFLIAAAVCNVLF